jgi:hypothetical protein
MGLIGRIISSPEWVAAYGQVISAVITLVSVIVLVWQIWKTSRRSEKLDRRARVAALQSLISELKRIRRVLRHYVPGDVRAESRGVPEMPVTAFETAFVSGSPALAAGEELVDAVCAYLVCADGINSLIEMYLHSLNKGVRQGDIIGACGALPEILDRLDDCLQRELEAL